MMRRITIIFSVLAVLAASSCRQFDVEEVLIVRDDVSLTVEGEEIFSYDKATCQISYNESTQTYRACDDNFTNLFSVVCDTKPVSEGQEVVADVEWSINGNTKAIKDVSFSVKKTDGEGRFWLWNKKNAIGVVIRQID